MTDHARDDHVRDDRYRDWDASYVLGALPASERLEYERHLETCAACRAAVAELAGMPGLLGRLSADEAVAIADTAGRLGSGPRDTAASGTGSPDAPPGPTSLAHVARRARLRRRRRRVLVGVTAALAVVAAVLGGIAVGVARVQPSGVVAEPSSSAGAGERYVMSPVAASALTVDLDVVRQPWGTRFDWGCSYGGPDVGGDRSVMYDLVVTRTDGSDTTVATWSAAGEDAAGLAATTDIPLSSIRTVEVRLHDDDRTLARVAL